MKPARLSGYSDRQTQLCERTLLTLLRGLGPWKNAIYLTGGLVPRYLLSAFPHAGTTDVDLVLDLALLAEVEAYRRLEQNLKDLKFRRGVSRQGRGQHFTWSKRIGDDEISVDLLCPWEADAQGRVKALPRERRVSAIRIPGAHLVARDYVEVEVTNALLDERGVATEKVRVANLVPFIVLKALAYEDRHERKDAYDLLFCLLHYGRGPEDAAEIYAERSRQWSDEPLLSTALDVLRNRFATDARAEGASKDGPVSYASFVTPAEAGPDLELFHRQDACHAVELFLEEVNRRRRNDA